jgi:AAA family ATP:ADP antiporter
MGESGPDDQTRPVVRAATLAAFLLITQQVAAKAARDALFLSNFPPSALPPMMVGSSLASALSVVLFSRAMARRSPSLVAPMATAVAAILLLLEWLLCLAQPRLAAVIVYLHLAIFGGTLASAFWSWVNERFDPWTARGVVGRIGLGAAAGGVAGGVLAWGASGLLALPSLLLVTALVGMAAVVLLLKLQRPATVAPVAHAPGETTTALATLRRVSYLRLLAAVVGIGALTEALLDYVLKAQASLSFREGRDLLSFFALFYTATGVVGLVIQGALSRVSLGTLGLSGTVSLRPLTVAAAAILGLFDPRLWTGAVARAAHAVLSNSLFRSGYELLYTPVPDGEKRPTKSVIDVGFDKIGALVGSTIVLLAVAVFAAPVRPLLLLTVVLSIVALSLAPRLHQGYVDSLEHSLRAGRVKIEPADVLDGATRHTITATNVSMDRETLMREIEGLRMRDAAARGGTGSADPLLAVIADLRSDRTDAIGRILHRDDLDPALVPHLIPLLGRNDLFLDVLRALRRLAPRITGQIVDALLDPATPSTLRRRLPRVLKATATPRAVDGLVLALADPRFDVRAQVGQVLVAITDKNPTLVVDRETVFAAVRRELAADGEWGGDGENRSLEHVFGLLSLVLEREPLKHALWAVRGEDAALRGTALEYLDNVVPESVRGVLWARLKVAGPTTRSARPARELIADLRTSATVSGIRGALRRTGPRWNS